VCECGKSVADLFLLAQFIRGIKDAILRERLLEESGLTVKIALNKAQAHEASKRRCERNHSANELTSNSGK